MPYPRRSRCFAMSIGKDQGQSLKVAGLYLEPPNLFMVSSTWVAPELAILTTFLFMHLVVRPKMLFIEKYNSYKHQHVATQLHLLMSLYTKSFPLHI